MNWFHLALLLFGMVSGNLGAVLLPAFNLGLFWNSLLGLLGAAIVVFGPLLLKIDPFTSWYIRALVAGAMGMILTLVAGALVEMRYRG